MSDRGLIFKQIHEIVFNGNGGYDWWTVYNLPVFHKKYIFKLIEEHFRKQHEIMNNGKDIVNDDPLIPLKPKILPKSDKTKPTSYNTKIPKK